MTAPKDNKLKIAIYSLLSVILIVVIYYYYGFLQQRSDELDQATQTTITKTFAGKKLETQVLKDKKFKDLQKVVVEEAYLSVPAASTSTVDGAPAAVEDIAQIPRRHGNPFKPF